ncbi:hypothetical protein [Paramesorhizobium deserti]|uniref:hypothetical protein n=1 Tax=Paramesorhizobium deserti TaxID=1494590 RepID=UPI00128FEAD2|nr:hypothetical protein [Paramesorhizobium deserti]
MKRAILSVILLSYSSVSLAEDPPELPPDVFTQVLSQTYNGRIYSPAAQFGNLLEIGVFAEFVNIAFGDGLPIPVDVHPIAQRVAQMWDDQLAAARIPVRVRLAEQAVLGNLPIRTANAAQERAMIGDDPDDASSAITTPILPDEAQQAVLGNLPIRTANAAQERAMIGDDPDDASSAITTPILPDEALEEYMYVNFRQPGIVLLPTRHHTDAQFQRFVQIFGTDNRQTIADALVFRTLAHEMGHALGLNHPNDTSEEPFDTAGRITLGWARTTTFTRDIAATPLMIGDQMAYLGAVSEVCPNIWYG